MYIAHPGGNTELTAHTPFYDQQDEDMDPFNTSGDAEKKDDENDVDKPGSDKVEVSQDQQANTGTFPLPRCFDISIAHKLQSCTGTTDVPQAHPTEAGAREQAENVSPPDQSSRSSDLEQKAKDNEESGGVARDQA